MSTARERLIDRVHVALGTPERLEWSMNSRGRFIDGWCEAVDTLLNLPALVDYLIAVGQDPRNELCNTPNSFDGDPDDRCTKPKDHEGRHSWMGSLG